MDAARNPAQRLCDWFPARARALPWREAGADGLRDPYRTWVSEVMLQQTRVEAVVPYFHAFLQAFPTVQDLARADLEAVLHRWSGLGYYRRARMLHQAARELLESSAGAWPRDAKQWRELPGIGPYTSAAIASLTLGEPVAVVDGNVKRVVARWAALELPADDAGLAREVTGIAQAWMEQLESGDPTAPGRLNEAMMELGATICRASAASCEECPLAEDCGALEQGRVLELPLPKKAKKKVSLNLVTVVLRVGARVLLRVRREGWNPGLYEPPVLSTDGQTLPSALASFPESSWAVGELQHVGQVRHAITHHDIRTEVFAAEAHPKHLKSAPEEWLEPGSVPLTGLARKALAKADASGRRAAASQQ